MARYRVDLILNIDEFEAGDDQHAESLVNDLLDKLAAIDVAPLEWPSCDWQLIEIVDNDA